MRSTALCWFSSFLHNHFQLVLKGEKRSCFMEYPRVLVLLFVLFNFYMKLLGKIIKEAGIISMSMIHNYIFSHQSNQKMPSRFFLVSGACRIWLEKNRFCSIQQNRMAMGFGFLVSVSQTLHFSAPLKLPEWRRSEWKAALQDNL